MGGFVPVAHDALAVCTDFAEQAAVFDLYRRAHALRWTPLRCFP